MHRRLAACGAHAPAGFAARAAAAWGEWPLLGGWAEDAGRALAAAAVEASRAGVGWAVGRDRVLFAGTRDALTALGLRLARAGAAAPAALGRWLAADCEPGGAGRSARGVPPPLSCGPYRLTFGAKTYVVGIVNRTVDSFSEERRALPSVAETVQACWRAYAGGADVVDLGAESSEERDRGGIAPEEELQRLLPVLEALSGFPALLSLDTRRAVVAEAALARWPVMINDVDALSDPALAAVVAGRGAPVVLMHSAPERPEGAGGRERDVMGEVERFMRRALRRARAAGVAEAQVVLDAGFGFGKSVAEDLESTRRLGELKVLGRPLLHAPSRKRTIGRVLAFPETIPERLPGTAAAVALGIAAGADLVRVHDLPEMARVARAADAFTGRAAWEDVTAV